MNKKQIITIGTLAALTAFAPQVQSQDADVEVKTDLPRVETETEIKRDKDVDIDARADTSIEADQKKVMRVNKASGLLGMEVRNQENQKLGQIKDLVMDFSSGKVSYAVMAVGGFLGVGEKLIAIPPSAFSVSKQEGYLTLNADQTKIEAAPGFAATSWPSVENPDFNKFWESPEATGAPATRETDRNRGDLDVDVDKKDKIYTDADEKKLKGEVDVDADLPDVDVDVDKE